METAPGEAIESRRNVGFDRRSSRCRCRDCQSILGHDRLRVTDRLRAVHALDDEAVLSSLCSELNASLGRRYSGGAASMRSGARGGTRAAARAGGGAADGATVSRLTMISDTIAEIGSSTLAASLSLS